MGIFSKVVTTDHIVDALSGFFDVGYASLVKGLKDISENEIVINEEQDLEILAVVIFSIMQAVISTFKDDSASNKIIDKFLKRIIKNYIKKDEENFRNLIVARYREYLDEINTDGDFVFRLGQIFSTNCFNNKLPDNLNIAVMSIAGITIMNQMIEVKKFFDEILEKCEVRLY